MSEIEECHKDTVNPNGPKHLDNQLLQFNTDSVEFCPFGVESTLACCCYQYDETSKTRKGALAVFNITPSVDNPSENPFKLSVSGQYSITECCSGLLDGRWLADDKFLAVASDGCLKIFSVPDNKVAGREVHEIKSVPVCEDSILLSLDFRLDYGNKVIVSASSGEIKLVNLDFENSNDFDLIGQHTCEAWSACFSSNNNNVIFAGSDDTDLSCWDIRSGGKRISSMTHPCGVCSVATDPRQPNTLVSGCYDDKIRFFDVRNVSSSKLTPVNEMNVYGGAWRIKFHPSDPHVIGLATMYDGFRILNNESLSDNFGHNDKCLGYGFDWDRCNKNLLATCSFYESLVTLWQL